MALLGAACSGDDGTAAGVSVTAASVTTATTGAADYSDPTMPEWIQRVQPEPNASNSAERAVSVDATTTPADQELRLIINGVDVTAQALTSEPTGTAGVDGQPATTDRLRYDPRDTAVAPLVELIPGEHSATAELRERSAFGEQTRLIDSYTWQFVLQ